MKPRHLFLAALLTLSASRAQALETNLGLRLASGVGGWIADQGNAALREMRDELRRDLENSLEPLRLEPLRPELPVNETLPERSSSPAPPAQS